MSVMSVSTVTIPLPSRRTRAADFMSRLFRNATATPMPTSHRPSRTLPGLALRFSQPKRCAPSRKHFTSCRCENGGLGLGFGGGSFAFSPSAGGGVGLSGTTWVSFRMRNSTGSMPSFSAISSIAISKAARPGASPGARMELASGKSNTASRFSVMRCSPA